MPNKHKLALLHDADWIAYQAAAAASKSVKWDDNIITEYGDLDEAIRIFENTVATIKGFRKHWSVALDVMCFTDTENWRKDVFPDYKRSRGAKPIVYWHLVDWIKENYTFFLRDTLEGDDCMGILSTRPSLIGADHAIICSPDKDFNTIPGEFFWIDTTKAKKHELKVVSEEEADHWHMLQTLMGDTTDGYGGCPGIGKDSALKFLEEPYVAFQKERVMKSGPRKGEVIYEWSTRPLEDGETLWDAIVSLFNKAGLTEEDALVQARVARILRASDYDFKEKRPILWTP